MIIRNVLRNVVIATGAIESVDTTGGYVRVAAGGRTYTAAGLEQSNLMLIGGRGDRDLAEEAMSGQTLILGSTSNVTVRWRAPE